MSATLSTTLSTRRMQYKQLYMHIDDDNQRHFRENFNPNVAFAVLHLKNWIIQSVQTRESKVDPKNKYCNEGIIIYRPCYRIQLLGYSKISIALRKSSRSSFRNTTARYLQNLFVYSQREKCTLHKLNSTWNLSVLFILFFNNAQSSCYLQTKMYAHFRK